MEAFLISTGVVALAAIGVLLLVKGAPAFT
jgi:hypothetical protein